MRDADQVVHTCGATTIQQQNSDPPPRGSLEDVAINESPSMSRSSSKASSIETSGKPPKPRRPTNYAERKSSISKRPSLSGQLKNLSLNPTAMTKTGAPSPPVSATSLGTAAFTPIIEQSSEHRKAQEGQHTSRTETPDTIEAPESIPYFPLPFPTRPDKDVPKAPATQMYWHQPPTHGVLETGPARRSHSIAQIGPVFYIFGGSDGKPPKSTNTIFIFDADTLFWRIPKVSGAIPPALRAHTTIAYRGRIYLYGGGTGDNVCHNHVYMFSTQKYRWTCVIESNSTNPTLPTPRRAHTAVVFDGGMYIFGGGSGTKGLNDLWRLDLGPAPHWTQLHPVGRKPEPRVYHTATVVRDVMIIYGGLDGRHCFSNIYLYNFLNNTYTELIVPSGPRPCRISHTTTCVGSQLFVFGGSDGSAFNNQLWIFDLTSKTWSLRPCAGTPPVARGYHTTVYYDARLWVFGGMDKVWEGFTDVNVLEFGGSGYLGSVYVDHVR